MRKETLFKMFKMLIFLLTSISFLQIEMRESFADPQLSVERECGDLLPLKWTSRLVVAAPSPLFVREDFTEESEWRSSEDDITGGYVVTQCFGEATPSSDRAVLHAYPPAPLTPRWARPVLLLTGAGDNALRSMSFFAVALSRAGFQSYALTFAHRHGDNFQQAELLARTIEFIRDETGAESVDLISYSKGTLPARIYTSHHEQADFSAASPAYAQDARRYAADVHSLFLIGGPNAGLDTPFRWSASNLFALQDPPLDTPTAWIGYYPAGTGSLLYRIGLEERSIYRLESAPYLGQAQMLSDLRDMHALPGLNLSLGAYANQTDYLTTYEGGLGFMSESLGIDRAIQDGGDTIQILNQTGVDPSVELFLIAGGNPIMSVGGLNQALYDSFWGDVDAAERRRAWEMLSADWLAQTFPWSTDAFMFDTPRLFAGTAFLGEISGASDGLVFVESALYEDGLKAAGAQITEAKLFSALNHAELIAASGLASEFYGDEELAGILYDQNLSDKYALAENQVIEYVIQQLKRGGPVEPSQGGEMAGAEAGEESGELAGDQGGDQAGDQAGDLASAGSLVEGGSTGPTGPDTAGMIQDQQSGASPSKGGRFDGSGCMTTRAINSNALCLVLLLILLALNRDSQRSKWMTKPDPSSK